MAAVDVEGGGAKKKGLVGAKPSTFTPSKPVPWDSLSPRITDGKGHYWNEQTQQWHNENDGSPYVEPPPYYIAKPGMPSQPPPAPAPPQGSPAPAPYYLAKPGAPSQPAKVNKAPSGGFVGGALGAVGGVVNKVAKSPVGGFAKDVYGATQAYGENYNELVQQGINKLPADAATIARGITGQPEPGGEIANPLNSVVSENTIQELAGPVGAIPGPVGQYGEQFTQNLLRNVTSPAGVAGFAVGGPISNAVAEGLAAGAQTVGQASGLPNYVTIPAMVAAGVVGGGIGNVADNAVRRGAVPVAGARTAADEAFVNRLPPRAPSGPRITEGGIPPAEAAYRGLVEPQVPVARQIDDILSPTGTRAPEPVEPPTPVFRPQPRPVMPRPQIEVSDGSIAPATAAEGAALPPPSTAPSVMPRKPQPIKAGQWTLEFETQVDRDLYVVGRKTSRVARSGVGMRAEPVGSILTDPVLIAARQRLIASGIDPNQIDALAAGVRQVVKDVPLNDGIKYIPSQAAEAVAPAIVKPPSTPLEAGLNNLEAQQVPVPRQPDVLGATGTGPPSRVTPNYEKAQEAARLGRAPATDGDMVMYKGQVYTVRGVTTVLDSGSRVPGKTFSLSNLSDGKIALGPDGKQINAPWNESIPVTLPPSEMSIGNMLNELGDRLSTAERARIHGQEEAWETRMRAGLPVSPERAERVSLMRGAMEEQVSAQRQVPQPIPDLAQQPAYQVASSRAVMDNLEPGEAATLDRVETGQREAIGAIGIEETLPPGYVSPWENAVPPAAAAVPDPLDMAEVERLMLGAWEAGATPGALAQRLEVVAAAVQGNPKLQAQVAALDQKLRGLGIKTKPDSISTKAARAKALKDADDEIMRAFEDPREVHPRKIDIDVDELEVQLVAAKVAGVPDDRIRYRLATARRAAGGSKPAIARVDALEAKLAATPSIVNPNWADDPAVFTALDTADRVLRDVPAGGFRVPQQPRVASLVEPPRPPTRMERVKGKAGGAIIQTANIPRTVKANLDASFVLRQGGALNVGVAFNPKAALRQWTATAGAGFRGLSPAQADAQQARILAKPRSPKLYIAPLDGTAPLTLREEAMLGSVVTRGKYNPLRVTSNANVVYLNTQRAMFYDMIVDGWAAAGKVATPGELDFVANFVNHATGRGGAAWLDSAMPMLSVGMFSPRYTLSRFQMLADPLMAPTWRTRWLATRVVGANVAMQAATAVAIGTLLKVAGVDYEIDPRSTDFGRVRIKTPVGTAVIDTTAGLNAPIRLATQLATRQYKSSTGAIKDRSPQETITRFLRSKASPLGGEVMDWFMNEFGMSDFTFDPQPGGIADLPGIRNIPGANEIVNLIAPITIENAVRYFSMANSPATYATAASLIAGELFGTSNSYRGLSDWEKRDQELVKDPEFQKWIKIGPDGKPMKFTGYDSLNEAGKLRARQKYPVEAFSSAGQLRADQKKNAEKRRDDRLQGIEDILRNSRDPSYSGNQQYSGSGLNGPGKKARDAVKDVQRMFAAELDQIYENAPDSLPSVVNSWRETVNANTWADGQTVDWDKVEAWEATLSPAERDELEQYFAVSAAGKTGIVKEISDASRAIGDSGFWDTHDDAWKSLQESGQFQEAAMYADIYEYRRQWVAQHAAEFNGDKEAAGKAFDKLPVAKAFETEKEKHVLQWVLDHPEEAKTAANWDYYSPTDTTRGYLATGDKDAIVTRQQEITVTQTVHNTTVKTSAGEAPFVEQPKAAWKQYARTLPPAGGKPAASYDSNSDYKEAGGDGDPWSTVSEEKYKKNPNAYIKFRNGTLKDGTANFDYLSPSSKADMDAIVALNRTNPRAVQDALRLGIPGFKTGDGGDLSKTEIAYLKLQGVNIP